MPHTAPRPVINILLIIELVLLAVFAYGYYRWAIEWRLNGVRTTGEVINKQNPLDEFYWVTYQYAVDGNAYTRQHRVTLSFYEDISVGQTLDVIYSPIDASVSGIPGQGGGDYDLSRLPGTFFDLRFLALVLPLLMVVNLVVIVILVVCNRRVRLKSSPDVSLI